MSLIALILVIASIFSFKTAIDWCKSGVETVISWVSDDDKKKPCISEDEITLKVGDNIILTTEHVTEKDKVRWESSNKHLATVGKEGKVQALKEGNVEIKLIVNDKDVDVCQIEIKTKSEEPKTPNYKLSAANMTLEVNEKRELTLEGVDDASKITWKSRDNSIATVSNGKIESKKVGTTQIIATFGEENYICDVTVRQSPDNIIIKIKSWQNTGKGEIPLTEMNYWIPTDKPTNVDKNLITYSSENTEIATVTNEGHVTPIAIGTTKIIVSYNGREQDSLLLTIKEKK